MWKLLLITGLADLLSDEIYLKCSYRARVGTKLHLDNPQTFNEKLQWLKLHDRNPLYTTLSDKYAVRQYIKDKIGEKYLIPLLGGPWESFDEINFDALPNQFVLKCTHDSGGVVVCRDKSRFDINAAREKISRCLKRNYYLIGREWPYKNVPPRIIAEQYMTDDGDIPESDGPERITDLKDYKFFSFNGTVKVMYVASNRASTTEETNYDFFDMDFQHLPFTSVHPNAAVPPKKPATFDEMRELAERLSQGFPHVRVDFYEIDGKVYFGEMTFYHGSGTEPFEPDEWDTILGSWIDLPPKTEPEGK